MTNMFSLKALRFLHIPGIFLEGSLVSTWTSLLHGNQIDSMLCFPPVWDTGSQWEGSEQREGLVIGQ